MLKSLLLLAGLTAVAAVPQEISTSFYFDSDAGFVQTHLKTHSTSDALKELCDPTVEQAAGYFTVDAKTQKNYFYWFFESRSNPSTDPVVLWLTGGPGCSSELALMTENGPCEMKNHATKPSRNENSWNSFANLLYVDQPAGTGFSYAAKAGYDSNEAEVSDDLYHFLIDFIKGNPKFENNDFYITGESYAGHYIPASAHRIWLGNKNKESDVHINLKGIAIGNGMTDPEVQFEYYAEMGYNFAKELTGEPSFSESVYNKMVKGTPKCIDYIKKCQENTNYCGYALNYCNSVTIGPYSQTGKNVYNIRLPCEVAGLCYDFSNVVSYFNKPEVQAALGVNKEWATCDYTVNAMFQNDWMKNFQNQIPDLLASNINVLVYAGDLDFICNWIGNKAWTLALEWEGKEDFNNARDEAWMVDGKAAGELRTSGHFQFLRVYEAGHMVPGDQPENALQMLKEFMEKAN